MYKVFKRKSFYAMILMLAFIVGGFVSIKINNFTYAQQVVGNTATQLGVVFTQSELEQAKQNAVEELDAIVDAYIQEEFFKETWQYMQRSLEGASNAIFESESIDEIDNIKTSSATLLQGMKQLDDDKSLAIASLEAEFNLYDEDNYSDENWAQLLLLKQQGIQSIKMLEEVKGIEEILDTAIASLTNVQDLEKAELERVIDFKAPILVFSILIVLEIAGICFLIFKAVKKNRMVSMLPISMLGAQILPENGVKILIILSAVFLLTSVALVLLLIKTFKAEKNKEEKVKGMIVDLPPKPPLPPRMQK